MIKQLRKSNIRSIPFKTKKTWIVDTISSGSITTGSNSQFPILDGTKIGGFFFESSSQYYNTTLNPTNWDMSYKRLIYNRDYTMFYGGKSKFDMFGVENIDEEVRIIGDNITSIHIPIQYYGEEIQKNSFKATDYSFKHAKLKIVDDGNSNLILSGSYFGSVYEISQKRNIDEENQNLNILYTREDTGKYITREDAYLLWESGETRVLTENSTTSSISRSQTYYNPENERFGYRISVDGNQMLVGSPMDENSLSDPKNGVASIFKIDQNTDIFRQIKILQSPFNQNTISKEISEYIELETENGNFLLHQSSGEIYISGSASAIYYQDDKFGSSVSINGDFACISALKGGICKNNQETGSGIVFCYQGGKGGTDNWGMINILEASSSIDNFGYATSIYKDTLAIGAPQRAGSGSVYIFKLKRYMSGGCDSVPTASTSWFTQSLSDSTGSTIQGTGSSGVFDMGTDYYIKNFWKPLNSECYQFVNSDSFDGIITDSGSFEIITDRYDPTRIFNEYSQVPKFVSGSYTWQLEGIINSPVADSGFGGAVSLSDGLLVIGNNSTSANSLAWLYKELTYEINSCDVGYWVLVDTLSYADGAEFDSMPTGLNSKNAVSGFGNSVSIDGQFIGIGIPKDRTFGSGNTRYDVGSTLIYRYGYQKDDCGDYSTFLKPIQKLIPSEYVINNNLFGQSIAMCDGNLVIGAPSTTGSNCFTSYTQSKFDVSDIHNDYSYDSFSASIGSAYYYKLDQSINKYVLKTELRRTKETGVPRKSFGYSVGSTYNSIVVGAPIFNIQTTTASHFHSQSLLNDPEHWTGSYGSNVSGSIYQYNIDDFSDEHHIGNVFYKNGAVILTNKLPIFENIFKKHGNRGFQLKYDGQHTIYETEYLIDILPGEFNVSTNPTAIDGGSIIYDVNQDGIFDINDLNILLKYINGSNVEPQDVESDVVNIDSGKKSWWKNDNIMLEGGDALILEQIQISNNSDIGKLSQDRIDYIENILIPNGHLNIDGKLNIDGEYNFVDYRDASLLLNYFTNNLTPAIVLKNITDSSTRKYANEIRLFLDKMTGRALSNLTRDQSILLKSRNEIESYPAYTTGNGGIINPNFLNYLESSSLDKTGSYLAPYITSIGLYSNSTLVAVAKLGKPIKNLIDYPLNISIRLDF